MRQDTPESPRPFPDHFSEVAGGYAAFRPVYPDALFDHLAALARGHDLAWDCGTGNGQAALGLARHFRRVVATDASPEQIALAPAHPRITFRVGGAERSALDGASVDLVAVAQALHWFDLPSFYTEARRVLRPDGLLAVWTYATSVLDDPVLTEILRRFHYGVLGPFWPPERAATDSGYRTLPFPFREVVTPRFEMTADWSHAQVIGYVRTWSSVRRLVAAGLADELERFEAEFTAAWGIPSRIRRISWPVSLRAGSLIQGTAV